MKKQFLTFMAIAGVSAALVGCSSPKTETTPSADLIVESTTSEDSNETTTTLDETTEKEDSSNAEDSEAISEIAPSETPTLEAEKTEEKVESNADKMTNSAENTTKPNNTTNVTNKPSATTKPQSGTTNKPQASTKPEVTPKPEATTKPEVSPTPETTTLSSSEVFSQITSGLELPTQTELDGDLLMNLYGIDESLLESYCVKMPMMSFQITEVGVFKVKDVNNVDSIVTGINKRANSVGSMLYPSLQETFDSRVVVTKGNYILFAMDENASTIAANFNNLIK